MSAPDAERGRPLGRGRAPDGADPVAPPAPELPPEDPDWRPSKTWERLETLFGGQLREQRVSAFPHLLIRATAGDRGARPVWPPTPCWASPDILVLPPTGAVDLSQAVWTPEVGKAYTVAVHIWNLGAFPALGVVVRAWWVEPGFFSGAAGAAGALNFIGGTFAELGDRDSGRAHAIVPIPQPWVVHDQADGHECLLAVVESFGDPWGGAFASNEDRHVAQRNVALIRGTQSAAPLLDRLGGQVGIGGQLTVSVSEVARPPLAGAVQRGQSSSADASFGQGPVAFGPTRPVGAVTLDRRGWTTNPTASTRPTDSAGSLPIEPPAGPSGPRSPIRLPTRTRPLSGAVAHLLGAGGPSATELLASSVFGGAQNGALHLTTHETGYTIVLAAA